MLCYLCTRRNKGVVVVVVLATSNRVQDSTKGVNTERQLTRFVRNVLHCARAISIVGAGDFRFAWSVNSQSKAARSSIFCYDGEFARFPSQSTL